MKQAELFKEIAELGELVKESLEAMGRTKKKKGTRKDKKTLGNIEDKLYLLHYGLDVQHLTTPALAKLFGFNEKQVRRHFSEYGAPRNEDKTFDLGDYCQWFRQHKDEEVKKAEASHGLDSVKERNHAEIEYKKAQAELQRLKIEQAKGGLVSKFDADEKVRNLLMVFKKRTGELASEASRFVGKDLVGTRKEMDAVVFELMDKLYREASRPLARKVKS